MDSIVFQHFRKEEQTFINQVEQWIVECQTQYAPVLTNFLDPRQQFIVEAIAGRYDDVRFSFDGGYVAAERCRCLLYPTYFKPTNDDFEMTLFAINYPKKFATLGHGRILGSIMSLGIDRSLIGDIISDGENWQFLSTMTIASYLVQQLQKIGKVSIRLEEVDYTQLLVPLDQWTLSNTTVSSLRLDTVIATVFQISRQRAKELVESTKVKVNWTEETRPDFMLDILDIISIRGFGRIQIRAIEGKTKKDKLKLEIGLLEKNKQ